MMVAKTSKAAKTNPDSRGTSPSKITNGKPAGSRGVSPSRVVNGKSIESRGVSPSRATNGKSAVKCSPMQSPTNTGRRSPSRTTAKRSTPGNSPNRKRGTSLERQPIRSRGNSPSLVRDELPKSRGSETGSIERLDDDNNLQRIITSSCEIEDNINVVVRVRPLNEKEIKSGETSVVQFPGNGQILCEGSPAGSSGGQKPKLFSYNVVFEPAATQEDVLQFSGVKRLIEMAVEGFRCTAFCYGQTGSGKTHTMTGPPGLFGLTPAPYSDKHGLVFRSFLYLFKLIQEKPDVHFVLKASFLEIYNEKVIDLLNPGTTRKPLAVRWSKKARGFFVENLFTVDCEELDDLIAVLEEGLQNRSVGKHNMNDYSSRSHTILTVYIMSEQPAEDGVFLSRSGKINFVDLAGSEMTKKTQSGGKTLEEANNINKSLMVLGYCISSLSDAKKKPSHIPYRDSKLTKLLADSLAGNGVTLMIACISPAKSNLNETINTLRYAARAKRIKTKPVVLMDPREALILTLKREVRVLQSENEHLRSALHVYSGKNDIQSERRILTTPPHVDLEKLAELEGPQLAELVRLYIQENEALRAENVDLFTSREMLLQDQELVCRENERLLRKLEDVNLVCCRSPIIPARPAFSAEMMLPKSISDCDLSSKANIWTNSESETSSTSSKQMPELLQKELDKRRIGKSLNRMNIEQSRRSKMMKAKSYDFDGKSLIIENIQPSDANAISEGQKTSTRRFSMAKANSIGHLLPENEDTVNDISNNSGLARRMNWKTNPDIFGSVISLEEDENTS